MLGPFQEGGSSSGLCLRLGRGEGQTRASSCFQTRGHGSCECGQDHPEHMDSEQNQTEAWGLPAHAEQLREGVSRDSGGRWPEVATAEPGRRKGE